MTKIARFCGIFCLAGMLIGILSAGISSVYPTSTGSNFTNNVVIQIAITFSVWAFFGYTIYGYSLRHNESNLDFEAR